MSDAGPTMHTCPRHKVETPLTCVTCQTPICPQCYVRTAVGLRCPKCAEGVTVKLGGRPKWPIAVAAAVIVAVVGIVLVAGGGGDGGDDDIAANGPTTTVEGGPAPGYRLVSRPDMGFSLEVPMEWQEGPGSDSRVTFAVPRTADATLTVTVNPPAGTLAETANRVVEAIGAEGGRDIVRTDTRLGTVPAVRISHLAPASSTPGAPLATRQFYLAVHNGKAFLFQLSTTDPGARESVFNYMASKFTLL